MILPARRQGKQAEVGFSIVQQATKLLSRYKTSFPIPVSPTELYRATYPDWVHAIYMSEEHRKGANWGEWNLVAGMRTGNYINYRMCSRGKTPDLDEMFWVSFEHTVLTGDQCELLVPAEYREQLAAWFKQVKTADKEIFEARKHVSAAVNTFSSYSELQLLWPDLARAVHIRVASPGPGIKNGAKLRAKLDSVVGPIDRRFTSDLLTKCLLLPDAKVSAWIGRQFAEGQANG